MGSVCASTLSLMDAGVPIKAPVAGVAMGLVKDGDYFTILTDIQGLEDALAIWTLKLPVLKTALPPSRWILRLTASTRKFFKQALAQAKRGREHIMGIMLDCISEPRKELSKYAPKLLPFMLTPKKSAKLLAPAQNH